MNYKFHRDISNMKLIDFINTYFKSEKRDEIISEMQKFMIGWNYFVDQKYLLSFDCNNLGQMSVLSEE